MQSKLVVRKSKDRSNLGSATHCSRKRECTRPCLGRNQPIARNPEHHALYGAANNNHITNQAPLKTLQRICEHHEVKVVQRSAKTLIEPKWAAACFDLFVIGTP